MRRPFSLSCFTGGAIGSYGGEADVRPEPSRDEPLPVGQNRDGRSDGVAEELNRRRDLRRHADGTAVADNRVGDERRQRRRRRRRRGAGECEAGKQDRREGVPHTSAPRAITRRSAQRRNAARTSPGLWEPTRTGSKPSERKTSVSLAVRSSCSARIRFGLRAREVDGDDAAGLRVGVRDRDRADVREGALPDGILDDDGDELPAVLERLLPRVQIRRRRGSRRRRTRTPASAGRVCGAWRCSRPRVTASAGAPNGRSNVPGSAGRLAPRRPPEDLALGVVDVAGQAPRDARAHPDQVDDREERARLVEPPQGRGANPHRWRRGRRRRRRAATRRRRARGR